MKTTITQPLLLLAAILSVAAPVHANDIKVPGSKFNGRKPEAGTAVVLKKWAVDGNATWVFSDDDFSIELPANASLSTTVEVPTLTARKGRPAIKNPQSWCGIASVEVVRAASNGVVTVTLTPPSGAVHSTSKAVGPGMSQVWVGVPAKAMVAGEWKVSIRATGEGSVVVDDFRWVRLPTDPKGMVFAKPNGFHGPDRLESGALGFSAYTEHQTIPLPVQSVRAGGPAAQAGLVPGDVIIAVDGVDLPVNSCGPGHDWFRFSHESVLGRAGERALSHEAPVVRLTVMRGAAAVELSLPLVRRAPLPDNFPFDDTVTPKLYDDLIDFVRRTRKPNGRWANGGNEWIQTSFAGLALLGRRDPQDRAAIKEIADWFLKRFDEPNRFGNLGYWSAGYSGIFLMEYALATGDARVLPWAERSLRWVERGTHTSKWGTAALGHGPNGLPYGQKALMAPATHVIVFEALADRVGVKSGVWKKIFPYMRDSWSNPADGGHGAMGYNQSYRDKGEFWSRTGLFALAAHLRGVEPGMQSAMAKIMRERHAWMRNSHAYGYPGDVWGLIGLSQIDANAFGHVMREWHWAFGGAWQPGYGLRHTTAHMGSPYMGGEGLINPALAALLSVRHGGLAITGAKDRSWLDISDLPTEPSAVQVHRESDGRVSLTSVVPGTAIHFTLDETPPTQRSPRYTRPIAIHDGGSISARTISTDGKRGPVAVFHLELAKVGWQIDEPNPVGQPAAHRRAQGAIDSIPRSPWRTDRGHEHATFPFTLVIDLGSVQTFSGLFLAHSTAQVVDVTAAKTTEKLDTAAVVATGEFKKKIPQRIRFDKLVTARYVKLTVRSGLDNGKHLSIGEVDLLWPTVTFAEVADRRVALACDYPGLTIRVSENEQPPTVESPVYRDPMEVPGRWLQARLFDSDNNPVGPVRPKRFK